MLFQGYEGTSVDIASFSAEAGGESYSNVASPEGQGGAELTGDQGEGKSLSYFRHLSMLYLSKNILYDFHLKFLGEDFSQDVGEAIQVLTSSGTKH